MPTSKKPMGKAVGPDYSLPALTKAARVRVTPQLMRYIADEMAIGRNLLDILGEQNMPSYAGVMRAIAQHEELYKIYRGGRVRQAEYLSDRATKLASDPLPTHDAQGRPMDARWLNAEMQRRKMELETIRWTMTKMSPNGIRDRVDDKPQHQAMTISWAGGEVEVRAAE
jgi:hypothetical protein